MNKLVQIVLTSALAVACSAQAPINETYYGCIGQSERECETRIERIAGVKLRTGHFRNCAWHAARASADLDADLGQEICRLRQGTLRATTRLRSEKGGRCGYVVDKIVCHVSASGQRP
jgi:hypothetical protein